MDIQAEKIQLIEWLAALNKPSTIKKLVALKEKEIDWWDKISAEEKSDIEEGLAQADRGQVVPHHKVMERFFKQTQVSVNRKGYPALNLSRISL